ncbi:hypothetical protein KH201010_17610 [Edwardsiella ictaluri]|nr:hypothetical protein KH201010_17610 [Edwardsiella ictaluri]BEI09431.1 hypothetical protein STU22726_17620 [Edwardsiella ictaluri]BEI16389.1 hypothetical protein STA22820_17620 [Edwardsiella ictaluri]
MGAGAIVVDLMQGAKAQTLADLVAEWVATGHIGKSGHHTAGPLTAALAALRIFSIGDIEEAVAGTGWAAGGAAVLIVIPQRTLL